MIFSYEKIKDFKETATAWKIKNPADSPFLYAIGKIQKQITKLVKEVMDNIAEKLTDAEIDSYAVDEKTGIFLLGTDGRTRQQTPEKYKAFLKIKKVLEKEMDEKLEKIEFNIEPHIATVVPENLTLEEKEVFSGIVI